VPKQSPERIRRVIVRAVRRSCPAWLAADAEDIAQAATLKVLAELERREGGEPLPSSYLWRTAHSELVDEIRRRRRRPEDVAEEDQLRQLGDSQRVGPHRRLEGRELGAAIRACLRGLIEVRRRATVLHLLGYTVPEIAHLLGWPRKRADNLAYRGMADLRACLTEKGYGGEPPEGAGEETT
jgi:RNA polymerase sigma-70 factor, ECF subfamily